MYYLNNMGVPYQYLIQGESYSINRILKANGYTTVAMHPEKAENWNRDVVYPYLGFDEFCSLDDYEDVYLMRGYYASDESNYQNLIRRFEERTDDEKMFLFNITMQNHGSYALEAADIEEWVLVREPKGNYNEANQYLSCMRQSDHALEMLIEYFEQVNEPVILCFFGDHQPAIEMELVEELMGKSQAEFTFEEMMKLYQVPFLIWANYELEEGYVEAISMNYLSNFLLAVAGVEPDGYGKFLLQSQKEIPVITALGYMDAQGTWHESVLKQENEVLKEYELVQYRILYEENKKAANTAF